MDKKYAYIAISISLIVICLMGCTPNRQPVEPAVPDVQLMPANADRTTVRFISAAGSDMPITMNITLRCFDAGYQEMDVVYSPTDYHISSIRVHDFSNSRQNFSLVNLTEGHLVFSGYLMFVAGSTYEDVRICYSNDDGETSCLSGQVQWPLCPPPVFNWRLLSASCFQDHMSFRVDTGVRGISNRGFGCTHLGSCTDTAHDFFCYRDWADVDIYPYNPSQLTCDLTIPNTVEVNIVVCVHIPNQRDNQPICSYLADLSRTGPYRYTCYGQRLPTSGIATETVNAPNQPLPPAQTCEDQVNYDTCKAFGGCYWWSSGGCYSYPEPPPPSCSDYSGVPDKCKDAGCYYWSDGTCSDSPEPPPPSCDTHTDEKECTTSGCKWDPNLKPPCY